jgi:hypothetical protein
MDHNLPCSPETVIEFKDDDLSSAQAEPGKQKQNRVIAAPGRCRSIRFRQDTLDFLRGKKSRRNGLAVLANGGNRRRQISCNPAGHKEETQKGTKCRAQEPDILARPISDVVQNKIPNRQSVKRSPRHTAGPASLGSEKAADEWKIDMNGVLGKAAVVA